MEDDQEAGLTTQSLFFRDDQKNIDFRGFLIEEVFIRNTKLGIN